ncbi:MAG: hypothetical protein ACK5P5_13955 [Pseudobdellovibrionaceae bacterium]
MTIRDQHIRRLPGTYLKREEINEIFKNYKRRGILFPTAEKIPKPKNADDYDELIAVWVDYFNGKLKTEPPLDPDVFKALLANKSTFRHHPPENKTAFGIAQITKETWSILQNPKGEATEFIFSDIRQKDLKEPSIAIPRGVRWLIEEQNPIQRQSTRKLQVLL